MSRERPAIVLDGATIVTYDSVETRPLTFVGEYVREERPDAYPIDLRDHFVFPGLVNAHDHLQLNCIPPLPHDTPFANSYEWIEAFEAYRSSADVAVAVRIPSDVRHWHGGLKNILSGVTTAAHHDPWHSAFDDAEFPIHVPSDFGWSHSLGLSGASPFDLSKYGPGTYMSFITTPPALPWIIHLAEGVDGVAAAELIRLDELGCLAENTVIVHGVGLTPFDIERIIDSNASVVWCPSSNLEMFGRTLDPGRPFKAGCVALGTDSRLTGSRDLLEELRVAADHCDLTPQELVRLVTADGAGVLRTPLVGGLSVGQRSDCIVVRGGTAPHDALLQTTRATIRAVVRGGAPVIADPDFADWFARCGVGTVTATLDGRPKLIARHIARPETAWLEPGLEIDQ